MARIQFEGHLHRARKIVFVAMHSMERVERPVVLLSHLLYSLTHLRTHLRLGSELLLRFDILFDCIVVLQLLPLLLDHHLLLDLLL